MALRVVYLDAFVPKSGKLASDYYFSVDRSEANRVAPDAGRPVGAVPVATAEASSEIGWYLSDSKLAI
jgi:hypothetical protein